MAAAHVDADVDLISADVPRRATAGDLPSMLHLIREFYVIDRHEYEVDHVSRALAPMLDDDALGQVWVIDGPDCTPVGYAIVTWSWSLESGGRDCILDEIYVREQGAGRGSVLIEHAMAQATAAGCAAMFLETEAPNDRARAFYARHGLAAEDSIWMSAALPPGRPLLR